MTISVRAQGSGIKDIAKLAWPIMLSMGSYTIMDATDTLMVGGLGMKELAAVGVATTVLFLLKSFFLGLFESVKILCAQSIGEKDANRASAFGYNGLYLAVPCALIVFILGFFDQEILTLFGGPEDIRGLALRFFRISIYASMLWFFSLPIANYLQGIGDTKTPMYINVFVCLLNLALQPLFIYGVGPIPAMGVEGSALATVIATGVGTVLFIWVFLRKNPRWEPFEKKIFSAILRLGWPSGVRWFFDIAGFTIFTAIVARLGEAALAANQICLKMACLAVLPAWGIAEATCILAGNHFGAKRYAELRRTFFSGLKVTIVLMLLLAVVIIGSKNVILNFLNPGDDVFALCGSLMVVVALFQLFEAIQNTCSLALAGTGDTRFPMVSSVLSSWVIMLPLAYFLGIVCDFGLLGMWSAAVVHLTLLSGVICGRFLNKRYLKGKPPYDERFTKNPGPSSPSGPNEPLPQML